LIYTNKSAVTESIDENHSGNISSGNQLQDISLMERNDRTDK